MNFLDILSSPLVVAIVSGIIGFAFDVWKTAPSRKITRSLDLIKRYAPVIFNAVEEAARVAKKHHEADPSKVAKIDKSLMYEESIKNLLSLYGGAVNDAVIKYAHDEAKSLNLAAKGLPSTPIAQ